VSRLRVALLTLGGAGSLGALLALSGAISVKASSGHLSVTAWMLDLVKVRSVVTRSFAIDVPALDQPELVRVGAAHFERGCRPCHGLPWQPRPLVPAHMTPHPPELAAQVGRWRPRELFYVVAHGIKFTGMPAWPALQRTDEAWAVVAFLRQLSRLDERRYAELIESGRDTATLDGERALEGELARCGACHRPDHHAVPRLAGQSAAYIRATLDAYAAGQRFSGVMQTVAAALDPAHRAIVAGVVTAASAPTDGRTLDPATGLVAAGDPARDVPPCASCHGPNAADRDPRFPRLAGQPAPYLELQLRLFAEGRRGGTSYADIMRPIAERLTPDQRREAALAYAHMAPGGR
jgi:cytochrome c553